MKKIIIPALAIVALVTSCKKSNDVVPQDFNTLKTSAISDFVNVIAIPGYTELKAKAAALNVAVTNLNSSTTEENLTAAKNAWVSLRVTWERCEGFLLGPIEDNEYDPDTDTWPVNYTDMNDLLASSNPLAPADINALDRALKGFHPIEFILWGQNGNATAASLTARQKTYLVSLTQHLKSIDDALYDNWVSSGGNYANEVLTAGNGSTLYTKKQDLFLSILTSMTDICGEVGDGKMKEPFDTAIVNATRAEQLVESPFSGNSVADFRNNITGAYNVYLGKFNDDGTGLTELVRSKNLSLDNSIRAKFEAAIASFDQITKPYGKAIAEQPTQCVNAMNAINDLAELLDTDLRTFIVTNITD